MTWQREEGQRECVRDCQPVLSENSSRNDGGGGENHHHHPHPHLPHGRASPRKQGNTKHNEEEGDTKERME